MKQRFNEHNAQRGGVYTSKNQPFKFIFYEACLEKTDDVEAEKFFKTGFGREVMKDKVKNYLKVR